MSIFEELIKFDEIGNANYTGWIEWNHIFSGKTHCPVCLKLDRCWFDNTLMPQLPQHDRCHCSTKIIAKPIPYINTLAKCDIKKFRDYIFGDKYVWNGKRELFELLGFSKENSEYLKEEYERQALKNYCESNYELGLLDIQGQRINIDIHFEKNGRKIVFNSGWMVRPKGEITNNTPLAD